MNMLSCGKPGFRRQINRISGRRHPQDRARTVWECSSHAIDYPGAKQRQKRGRTSRV